MLINETAASFQIMEKDLVPLVDVPKKPVFYVETESQFLDTSLSMVKSYCDIAYVQPQKILEEFT